MNNSDEFWVGETIRIEYNVFVWELAQKSCDERKSNNVSSLPTQTLSAGCTHAHTSVRRAYTHHTLYSLPFSHACTLLPVRVSPCVDLCVCVWVSCIVVVFVFVDAQVDARRKTKEENDKRSLHRDQAMTASQYFTRTNTRTHWHTPYTQTLRQTLAATHTYPIHRDTHS